MVREAGRPPSDARKPPPPPVPPRDDGEGRVARTLREMFPEIRDALLIGMDHVGHSAGAAIVCHTWLLPGSPVTYYQTEYNAWLLRSPYTKIRQVTRRERRVVDYFPVDGSERMFGIDKNGHE